jgi:hypothetical protein
MSTHQEEKTMRKTTRKNINLVTRLLALPILLACFLGSCKLEEDFPNSPDLGEIATITGSWEGTAVRIAPPIATPQAWTVSGTITQKSDSFSGTWFWNFPDYDKRGNVSFVGRVTGQGAFTMQETHVEILSVPAWRPVWFIGPSTGVISSNGDTISGSSDYWGSTTFVLMKK